MPADPRTTRPLDCAFCNIMPSGRACLTHTCIDCGHPTSVVHGSPADNLRVCPPPIPGWVAPDHVTS